MNGLLSSRSRPITLIDFKTGVNSSGFVNVISISKPTVSVGDILIATVFANNAGTWTGPANFTEVLDTSSRYVGYRVVDGTEASSFPWTLSTSSISEGIIMCFRNASYDTVGSISAAAQSPAAPAITLSANRGAVIASYSINATGAPSYTFSTPTNYTSPPAAVGNANIQLMQNFYRLELPSGDTGTVSSTFGGTSTNARGVLIGLKPK